MDPKPKKLPKFELKFRSAKKIRTLKELGRASTTIGTALIPVAIAYYVSSHSAWLLCLMIITGEFS